MAKLYNAHPPACRLTTYKDRFKESCHRGRKSPVMNLPQFFKIKFASNESLTMSACALAMVPFFPARAIEKVARRCLACCREARGYCRPYNDIFECDNGPQRQAKKKGTKTMLLCNHGPLFLSRARKLPCAHGPSRAASLMLPAYVREANERTTSWIT